ncbi:hypothetical protein [Phycicoccus sp. Soil748]|uniref:hypothetical protein n=1 Tax=Phycicoccus sp. Soil748 TaxID=1736397 RepID=UPI0007028168|nr:hypothetical protein [Phycicoccus sp. Soil748]KRE56291.1 hypothetical protein ASG70_03905 [Phycicoccus sp. Soil748]
MISVELARGLSEGGVLWEPAPGDRFTIDQPNVVGEVFWISHLTIDVHTFHGQPLLGFNGTTEWALDSVTLDTALWMPREDQLRVLLGDRFVGLRREGGDWLVDVVADHADADGDGDGDGSSGVTTFRDADPECAYALALLSLV